jgi:hypothetical protein
MRLFLIYALAADPCGLGKETAMCGHVFIVRGDITRLACDAWLMPGGNTQTPGEQWYKGKGIPGISDSWKPKLTTIVSQSKEDGGGALLSRIENWPEGRPRPWLVNVAVGYALQSLSEKDKQRLVRAAAAFFDQAAVAAKKERILTKRAKPLLALPLIATGRGGAAKVAGEVVRVLLPTLYEAAKDHDVDIVLVTYEADAYAASMVERNNVRGREAWLKELTKCHLEQAEWLAERARQGRLSLFIGAGVSAGAGAPLWKELLSQLVEPAKIKEEQQDSFDRMDVLDQASLIASRLEREGSDIRDKVAEIFAKYKYYALGHAMLAALPVNQVITTNYDTLFEDASRGMEDRKIAVLPWKPANEKRWLLKMHGDVNHPKHIVLVRSDYMRYDERRSALRGIVQTMLITGHMMFVGFSFTDDNLYYVMDDVHRALSGEQQDGDAQAQDDQAVRGKQPDGDVQAQSTCGPPSDSEPRSFGTVLRLQHDPLSEELWKGDLQWVWFDHDHSEDVAVAARKQEIFLDYLASLACDTSVYLLNDRFEYVLSQKQKELKKELRSFADRLHSGEFQELPALQQIQDLLERFGYNDTL